LKPAKTKAIYVCQQCGAQASKWLGRCPGCQAWDSLAEEIVSSAPSAKAKTNRKSAVPLSQILLSPEQRSQTGIADFDRVLGGGLTQGALILVGGEPGIGKSTLLLQLAGGMAAQKRTTLYVSGEESDRQIKMRADRLGISHDTVYLLSEIDLAAVEEQIQQLQPQLVIIDSIQTMVHPDLGSAAGSVGQVREGAARFQALAKSTGIPIFLVGHVTKDGTIAGPRILEHIVDTVLSFEGDAHHTYRMLRAVKNRFGPAHEVAIFEMRESGLHAVGNPSEVFLAGRMKGISGAVTVCVMEGTRPYLIELQALVGKAHYGVPQRVTSGVDGRRLSLLLAVMEKSEDMPLGLNDVFLNVVGGFRIEEPALDLGIVCTVASSFFNNPLPDRAAMMGEAGLGGEIRPVQKVEARLREMERLGFTECLMPAKSIVPEIKTKLKLHGINTVREAVAWAKEKRRS